MRILRRLSLVVFIVLGINAEDNKICFENDMLFGVATAAYQIEGGWNVSGKGENIWDRYTHQYPERVFDHQNGDVSADSYHQIERDLQMLEELGVQFYRFSISWSRILPTGFSNVINQDGIAYYNKLLAGLKARNIGPIATMYHWDLPQPLQDLGGWTNPIIADYFEDYAKVLFDSFGDKVTTWLTFNEPLSFCQNGYGGNDAPGGRASGIEDYMCGHNVLRAHGKVYNLFKRKYQEKLNGQEVSIGITLDLSWLESATTSQEDQIAAETARQFNFGWFAHPIFTEAGDYPPIMRKRIDEMSAKQGFPRSRLPYFTKEEVDSIRGSFDFLGLNHYTTYLVSQGDNVVDKKPSFGGDVGVVISQKADWPRSNSTWLKVVPWGFRKTLNWIKKSYNNPRVVVTENGMSLQPGLKDLRRINYLDGYLRSLHASIFKDGCDVVGYTYWSLIDNFEWMRGYSERFGLYEVDYNSPKKTRTPRLSAEYYSELTRTKCLPQKWDDE